MERVESFLAVEQRVRWCGVGVVDISSFKWYNDTLGHARRRPDHRARRAHPVGPDPLRGLPGARTRRRVARSARAVRRRRVLLPDPRSARGVPRPSRSPTASRRRSRAHDWTRDDRRLSARPVRVDVGVVCLRLGTVVGAPRRRAQAGRRADPPRRHADVRRQGPARPTRSTAAPSASTTASSSRSAVRELFERPSRDRRARATRAPRLRRRGLNRVSRGKLLVSQAVASAMPVQRVSANLERQSPVVGVAQWQSAGLWLRKSRVRTPSSTPNSKTLNNLSGSAGLLRAC